LLITCGKFDRVIIYGEKKEGCFVQVLKESLQCVTDGLFKEGFSSNYTLLGGGNSYIIQPEKEVCERKMNDGFLESVLFSLGFEAVSAEEPIPA